MGIYYFLLKMNLCQLEQARNLKFKIKSGFFFSEFYIWIILWAIIRFKKCQIFFLALQPSFFKIKSVINKKAFKNQFSHTYFIYLLKLDKMEGKGL